MTDPSFDRQFTAWLDERADPNAPAGLAADIIGRTARSRPRRAWRIPERWFSMPTTIRLAFIPRSLVLLLITLWLLLALAVGAATVGGRLSLAPASVLVPAPVTGPAVNGLIAFERNSDIYVVGPDGTGQRPLITAPGVQVVPAWSRDGTRIAYWSAPATGAPWIRMDLVEANADGSDARTVATNVIETEDAFGPDWSPEGSTLVFSARTIPRGQAPCTDTATEGELCSMRIFRVPSDGSAEAMPIGDPDLDARSPA